MERVFIVRGLPLVCRVTPACLICLALGACTVDATRDFQRTQQMVTEQTGIDPQVEIPASEPAEQRVKDLLEGDLTLEKALQISLINNREFMALFQEIGVSRAEVVQAGLPNNPSLSMLLRFPEGGGRPNLEVSIAQEIVALWQIPVKKKIAEAQLEQTVRRVVAKAVTLALEVKTRYYELLGARLAQQTARKGVDLVEQSVRSAEAQFKQGETSRLDVNLQRVNLLDANLGLLGENRNVRVAELELARVLGLVRRNDPLSITGDLPRPADLPSDSELLEWAMRQRVDAQIVAFQVREAQKQIKLEILKIVPSVALGFDVEQTERRALPGRNVGADTLRSSIANGGLTAPSIQSRGERQLERRQIIDAILGPTITITIPIWDQNQAQIAKARFRVEQRRLEFENVLDQVTLEVQRAAAQARGAAELWRYYEREALPAAEETVDGARRVFQQGEASILALIEAQRSLVTRRASFVDVRRSYAVAIAELEAAVGGRMPSVPASQPAGDHDGPHTRPASP